MLKEVSFTPQVFNQNVIGDYLWRDASRLLELLSVNGILVGVQSNDWIKAIYSQIDTLEGKPKAKLLDALSLLKERNRLVSHPKVDGCYPETEEEWLTALRQVDSIRHLDSIYASSATTDYTKHIDELEDINLYQEYGVTGSIQLPTTSAMLKGVLLPFLSYAKKLTIIDPYFYLDQERYQDTLMLVAQSFRERRGKYQKGKIIINCKWDPYKEDFRYDDWRRFLAQLHLKQHHDCIVNIWQPRKGSVKMHDRYIITDQAGLVSAAGLARDDNQNSEWSFKDYSELGKILAQYQPNSSPFVLKAVIDKDDVNLID
jgi:hypothetical protein